jgi:hypothetical protein
VIPVTVEDAALALEAAAGASDFTAAVAKERALNGLIATLLAHELGVSHRLMMRLAARADGFLDCAEAADEDRRLGLEPMRAVGGAARMMERYRLGLLALARLRGDKPGKVKERIVRLMWGDGSEQDGGPAGGPPPSAPRPPELPPAPARPKGIGQLLHGNPFAALAAAPRCGAGTRACGACRQLAMANCR